MPVTGLAALQDASSGQQTSGSESEEHLDAVKHTKERGDGCTHGLLRGQDGEDFDADQSIYADKTMQREGQRAGFDRPKSGFSAVLPLPVSILNLMLYVRLCCHPAIQSTFFSPSSSVLLIRPSLLHAPNPLLSAR